MDAMRRFGFFLLILLAGGVGAASLSLRASSAIPAQKNSAAASAQKNATPAQGDIERGRYLVDDVAMCSECHTPRDASGNRGR